MNGSFISFPLVWVRLEFKSRSRSKDNEMCSTLSISFSSLEFAFIPFLRVSTCASTHIG